MILRGLFVGLVWMLLLQPFSVLAQRKYTISGHIRDANSGETLTGANVLLPGQVNMQTTANSYGFYSLTLDEGQHRILFSHVGYQRLVQEVTLGRDTVINIQLTQGETIEEIVVVSSGRVNQVTSPQMGVAKVDVQDIKHVPVLFGEKDLLKTIQLLPGVMSGGEGGSDFYVRGGMGDHNLILLDEAMVYNASHLFGFFSTFNSDAIKDVSLYKGGIPAQYGGRLASVLDIAMLDGNNQKFAAEGGVGLIASRLKLEGPIVRDKGSFMVSGRRTYADMFLKLSRDETINESRLFFYDLNAKANYRFNDRNTLYISGYFGKDVLGYARLFDFDWGNATTTVRWNHIFNSRLFSNTTAVYSNFNYNVNINSETFDFKINSRILNYNLKQDFQWYANHRNTVRFGVNLTQQEISPASIATQSEDAPINSLFIESRRGTETAAYASHEWKPSARLNMIYGLRLNGFMLFGPGTFHDYDVEGDLSNSTVYGKGEIAQQYWSWEPRLSLSYLLGAKNSLKASFNRTSQNLHQLSNSTSSLPTDAWVMSSNHIKPQIADQVAIGYYQDFGANAAYEFSVEAYYKDMQNQIDYRNGADLQANEFLEGELLFGVGRAYGAEFFLKRNRGKLNGWLSYTLSKSERQFDKINNGDWFNARQDRTHDISAVLMYQLSNRWNLSATYVYSTGNAVTFPSGKYQIDGRTMWYYTERNGYRMPDYHRLDLGATYEGRKRSRYQSSWTFGVYNAYNKKNAYIIDFRENADNPNRTEMYRIALFGIIPSVTWNFSL